MSGLATALADVQKVAHMLEPALVFAVLVQHVTGVGGPTAAEVIASIRSGLQALEDAAAGVPRDEVLARLATIKASVASSDATNDNAADVALAARFPVGTP